MNKILGSIKKMLGVDASDTAFDTDIIININSVFMFLSQIGIGPVTPFSISTGEEEWSDFLGTATHVEAVKTYMYLKVRMMFDPPASSFVADAITRQLNELEWRLNFQAESQE